MPKHVLSIFVLPALFAPVQASSAHTFSGVLAAEAAIVQMDIQSTRSVTSRDIHARGETGVGPARASSTRAMRAYQR